jgi:hypothetical protein
MGGALAVVLFSLAIVIALLRLYGGTRNHQYIYVDLESGQLFTGAPDQAYPVMSPAGTASGVRAFVYTCHDCTDQDCFIGHLERMEDGKRLVRLPSLIIWYRGDSDKGLRIQDTKFFHECPNGRLKQCLPDDLF